MLYLGMDYNELLEYFPNTGEFTWKKRPADSHANNIFNAKFAGKKAGCDDQYRKINIGGKLHLGHRVAWIMVHGSIPEGLDIDHRNGNKLDNRLSNLRLATRSQNMANTPTRGKYEKGVSRNGSRWKAEIMKDGKRHHLGTFPTREAASEAYNQAAKELFGEFVHGST